MKRYLCFSCCWCSQELKTSPFLVVYIDIPGCRMLPITFQYTEKLVYTLLPVCESIICSTLQASASMLPMLTYVTYANCQFIGDMFKDMYTRLLAFIWVVISCVCGLWWHVYSVSISCVCAQMPGFDMCIVYLYNTSRAYETRCMEIEYLPEELMVISCDIIGLF